MTEALQANHPLAVRMAVIAFLSQGISFACMWGSFGVLLGPTEAKLGIGREMSSLSVPLASMAMAIAAPLVGSLVNRVSIRKLMILGALMGVAGYALLSVSTSIYMNYAAYGLLIGPGLTLTAAVLPATLVTRWFVVNRGRALGLIYLPIIMVLLPFLVVFMLGRYGLPGACLTLAALMAVSLIPLLFVVDYPPDAAGAAASGNAAAKAASSFSFARLAGSPPFWIVAAGFAAVMTGSMILGAHLVPMATGWGLDPTHAAGLVSVMSLVGMAGTVVFGWLADKIGGGRSLAIICIGSGLLWAMLLLRPPYPVLILVIGLIGMHTSGISAAVGVALSERFGSESFSRAFGLTTLIGKVVSIVAVPLAATVYVKSGSYAGALMGQAAFFLLAGAAMAALSVNRARAAKPATA